MLQEFQKLNDALYGVNEYLERNNLIMDEIIIFTQYWSDSACGAGGAGGQTFTSAYTIVVLTGEEYIIFVNGRYAYKVKHPSDLFYIDLASRYLKGISDPKRFEYETKNE